MLVMRLSKPTFEGWFEERQCPFHIVLVAKGDVPRLRFGLLHQDAVEVAEQRARPLSAASL